MIEIIKEWRRLAKEGGSTKQFAEVLSRAINEEDAAPVIEVATGNNLLHILAEEGVSNADIYQNVISLHEKGRLMVNDVNLSGRRFHNILAKKGMFDVLESLHSNEVGMDIGESGSYYGEPSTLVSVISAPNNLQKQYYSYFEKGEIEGGLLAESGGFGKGVFHHICESDELDRTTLSNFLSAIPDLQGIDSRSLILARDNTGQTGINKLLEKGRVADAVLVLQEIELSHPELMGELLSGAEHNPNSSIQYRLDKTSPAIQLSKVKGFEAQTLMRMIVNYVPISELERIDHKGNSALSVMGQNGMTQALEDAFAKGAPADPHKDMPRAKQLIKVAMDNTVRPDLGAETLKLILNQKGVSPVVRGGESGANTLNYALDVGDQELFDLAVSKGHPVNPRAGDERIPINTAINNYHKNPMFYKHAIDVMLERGASTSLLDGDWKSANNILENTNVIELSNYVNRKSQHQSLSNKYGNEYADNVVNSLAGAQLNERVLDQNTALGTLTMLPLTNAAWQRAMSVLPEAQSKDMIDYFAEAAPQTTLIDSLSQSKTLLNIDPSIREAMVSDLDVLVDSGLRKWNNLSPPQAFKDHNLYNNTVFLREWVRESLEVQNTPNNALKLDKDYGHNLKASFESMNYLIDFVHPPGQERRIEVDGVSRTSKLPEHGKPYSMLYRQRENNDMRSSAEILADDIAPEGQRLMQAFMLMDDKADGIEQGKVVFNNPYVVEFQSAGHGGWKSQLYSDFDGKSGEALSQAIKDQGYDGIITVDTENHAVRDIVNLSADHTDLRGVKCTAVVARKEPTKALDKEMKHEPRLANGPS